VKLNRGLWGWLLYDWAFSPFHSVITTFVFSTYFVKGVAANPTSGTADWAKMEALTGLSIALLSPLLGAIADQGGARKGWILALTLICSAATLSLWFVQPAPSFGLLALILVALGTIGNEMSGVFYNAMLPDLAPPSHYGRLSGWGWGIGYFGGLGCLILCLLIIESEPPLFGLNSTLAEPVRFCTLITGLWTILFALPLLLWTPDRPRTGVAPRLAMAQGLTALWQSLRRLPQRPTLLRFLLARLCYVDGLNTLFAFGGIFAAGTFGLSSDEVILFGISLNVTAGLGAVLFGSIDDRIGPKRTILISVSAIMLISIALLLVEGKLWFWVLGLGLGVFLGPAQAAGRSFMARLAPPEERAEMFGLFALSGKVTAFLGPAALAWATASTGSQRAGMATIVLFMALGLAGIWSLREEKTTA